MLFQKFQEYIHVPNVVLTDLHKGELNYSLLHYSKTRKITFYSLSLRS